MNKEKIIYCFMNKSFEFIGEGANITNDLIEAMGFEDLEVARAYKEDLDEPKEWKIVKKRIIFELEEIVDE